MKWLRKRRVRRKLQAKDPAVRADALEEWTEIGGSQRIERISAAVDDPEDFVRLRAIDLLVSLEAFDPLVELLSDDRDDVRREAAEALGDLRDPRALPFLVDRLDDPALGVRCMAAYALGDIGKLAAVEPLLGLLSDPEPAVRRIAIYALGNLGDPSAIEALVEVLTDTSNEVRKAASDAMHKLEDSRRGTYN